MLSIERLTTADVQAVVCIENELYFRPWSEKSFFYACENYISWLFLKKSHIVGYAIVDQIDEEGQLLNFSIAPAYQNQGMGQQALSQLLEKCYHDLGIEIIYLEVNSGNKIAIHIYKKLGFLPLGRRLGYYSSANGREDAISMYHSKNTMIV